MSEQHPTIETPLAQRLVDFRQRFLPAVVWSVAALAACFLLLQRAQRFEYVGLAQSFEYEISANTTGRVQSVLVDLFDDVAPGDIVAVLDDAPVRASIDTAQARIRKLTAELEIARTGLTAQDQADWIADLRRFQVDEESRRLDILGLKVVIESDRVELERHGLQERRTRDLVDKGFSTAGEYESVRLARDRVRTRVERNMILLGQAEEAHEIARDRRERYEEQRPGFPDDQRLIAPLREGIAVEARRLDEIELQRQALVLRSPAVGRVSHILCRRGQSVVPGEPIVLVAETSVREIVAYLDESNGTEVRESSIVLVSSRDHSGSVAESRVIRVGPAIEPLPQRLWRNPQYADFGRPVVIAATPAMQLTPGEMVEIRFLPTE